MKKLTLCLMLLLMPLFAWAKVPVVASFSIVADMVKEIGGDRVTVVSLVGPDQDAHVFQPSPSDVKNVNAAKVFVVNGLGLEGWMDRLTKAASFKGQLVVAGQGVRTLQASEDDEHGHAHTGVDPHAWHDPARAQVYIRNITAGLIKADPAGKAEYQKRAADFSAKVKALDDWAAKAFAAVPAAKRRMLTSHDAFGYLGNRYGIQLLAAQGVSTDSEPSAKGIATLIKQVRQEKVKAIFLENMTDKRLLTELSKEAGVAIGGELYSDALSKPSEPAPTYLSMFKYNVETILKSFK